MKKLIFLSAALLLLANVSLSQMKVTKATSQKTFAGMGGVFMNYVVAYKGKTSDSLVIDSVKTIADGMLVRHSYNYNEKGPYELTFGQALSKSPKCKTCPDTDPKQVNFTKGVIVYYRKGGKKATCKVKKFTELPDVMTP